MTMTITERFKRLSFWNKFNVIGGLASIVAIPLALLLWCFGGSSPTPSSPPVSVTANPQVTQNVNVILNGRIGELNAHRDDTQPTQVQATPVTKADAVRGKGPPTFPDPAGILNPPTGKQADVPSKLPAKNVTLLYRNVSGVKLTLLLYDWYYHYHPVATTLAPQIAWRRFDFHEDGSYKIFSDFARGTGLYSFYVEETETGRQHQCGTRNIFDSERPTLTVRSTGDKERPFKIDFGVEEQP